MADALVKLLNAHGYQPLLGRVGLAPPAVYTYELGPNKERALKLRGALASYLPSHVKPLAATSSPFLESIEGTHTSSKDVSASLKFLSNILRCIGVTGEPKLDLGFTGSRSTKFRFQGVSSASVEPAAFEPLLRRLNLSAIPSDVIDRGKLFIAYEYLAAETVEFQREDEGEFKVDVSANVSQYVDVGVDAKVSVATKDTLAIRSAKGGCVFAAKVGRLVVESDGTRKLSLDSGRGFESAGPVIPFQSGTVALLDAPEGELVTVDPD